METAVERLRRWFESTGKPKKDVGPMVGVSGAFFGMILDGSRLPGLETAVAIQTATSEKSEAWNESAIAVEDWIPLFELAKQARAEAKTGTEG